MDPQVFAAGLESSPDYCGQIVHWNRQRPREAEYSQLSRPLRPTLQDALCRAGIERFYTHQAEAIDALRDGKAIVVSTPTASGKSLCYQVPALELAQKGKVVLYLSPTRALASDQLRAVRRFAVPELMADTYDSDTPAHTRGPIRHNANFVATNPDMLHFGILPNHAKWSRFLRRLALVVVDEAHALRGVFGSHVALVLRRLRRLASRYGSQPSFAVASATIGNPLAHALALTGLEEITLVTSDGAPSPLRHFLFWNPPLDENGASRASSNTETARLVTDLVAAEMPTLAFSSSRVAAELVSRYANQRSDAKIAAYRAGYLASERREIEAGLKDGTLSAVSATNALELGIDIGGLDAVVINGFPGTVASARQQAGRAGRERRDALAILVASAQPLDQYYVANPDDFFGKPNEAALVNPSNPFIHGPHLGCAAYEHPLETEDLAFFDAASVETEMESLGLLRRRRDRLYWAGQTAPAGDVNLRSASARPYRIVEASTGRLIGTSDSGRVFAELHPGAVYLHQGETWQVADLIIEDRVALVDTTHAYEYTQAKVDHDLNVLSTDRHKVFGPAEVFTGVVQVTDKVVGFARRRLPDGHILDRQDLDMPPEKLITRAVWYTIPESDLSRVLEPGLDPMLGALHAAEHACIGILPVFAMCDRWDIGGLSTPLHEDTDQPVYFIYDGYPMGAGICDHAYEVIGEHLKATRDHVAACPCPDGCPSCIQSPKCGNGNEYLDKSGAIALLSLLVD